MVKRLSVLLAVVALFVLGAVPAFAQVTEPADYGDAVGDFAGTLAASAWPIVLGLLGAVIGITLAVAGLRAGFRRIRGLVK